jgi:hypothetical protein
MSQIESGYHRKNLPQSVQKVGMMLAVIGLLLGIAGFVFDGYRASYAYLVSFLFFLSIAVGSLFLVALEYAANADWSTPFRRISEFFAAALPLLLIFVIPLFLNTHNLFLWSHADYVHGDKMLEAKSAYLNTPKTLESRTVSRINCLQKETLLCLLYSFPYLQLQLL